jgi:hypothetical protein
MTTSEKNGIKTITADEGMIFRRIHDCFEMGNEIALGIDYSTGEAREDLPEYYEEFEMPEKLNLKNV